MTFHGYTAEEYMKRNNWYGMDVRPCGICNGVKAAYASVFHDVLHRQLWVESKQGHCSVFRTYCYTTSYPVADDEDVFVRSCISLAGIPFRPNTYVHKEVVGPLVWVPSTPSELMWADAQLDYVPDSRSLAPGSFIRFSSICPVVKE